MEKQQCEHGLWRLLYRSQAREGVGKSLLLRQIEELALGDRTQGVSHQDLESYGVRMLKFENPREKSRDRRRLVRF